MLKPTPVPAKTTATPEELEQRAECILSGGRLAESQRTLTGAELAPIVELIRDMARTIAATSDATSTAQTSQES